MDTLVVVCKIKGRRDAHHEAGATRRQEHENANNVSSSAGKYTVPANQNHAGVHTPHTTGWINHISGTCSSHLNNYVNNIILSTQIHWLSDILPISKNIMHSCINLFTPEEEFLGTLVLSSLSLSPSKVLLYRMTVVGSIMAVTLLLSPVQWIRQLHTANQLYPS